MTTKFEHINDSSEALADEGGEMVKFLMIKAGERVVVCLLEKRYEHRANANAIISFELNGADDDLIGGGWVNREKKTVEYGSQSLCESRYHRDRPQDEGEATRYLEGLHTFLFEEHEG